VDNRASISQAEAERIAQFLALEAPPRQADLAFVFGTRHPDPAYIAAELFGQGVVRYVALTGGHRRLGVHEALSHLKILLDAGVPRERVIVERSSTNTLENVTLALPLIADSIELECIEAVVVVAKWYHCRRATMTLKRHLPPGIRYYTRTYEPNVVRREDWHLDPEATRRVLKEWRNIPRYLAQGDIAEVQWDGDAFV
jgi:uncharacterized SAM-binding protein YcdF (DUF218 family)